MIITLKSFADNVEGAFKRRGELGVDQRQEAATIQEINYSKAGLWGVLLCSWGLAILGLALCVVAASRDQTASVVAGALILLIGTYIAISAVKEKANLDLIARHFNNLSAEAKDELIGILVKANADSSQGILGLIETLLNTLFKKGSK
jgi:hypothetical protein